MSAGFRVSGVGARIIARPVDDLVISGVGVNPPGPVASPTYNDTLLTTDFSGSADNRLDVAWQLPHRAYYGAGAMARIHLHMQHADAVVSTSLWRVAWCLYSMGSVQPAFSTEPDLSVATFGNLTENYVLLKSVPITGYGASAILKAQITRLGSSDAYAGIIRVSSYDVHIQIDSDGSELDGGKS